MTRLNEVPTGESITGCFYGGAGKGKTWCMGTAGDRTLYCDVENRLATIQSKAFQSKFKFNPLLIQVSEEPIPDGGAKALAELTRLIKQNIKEHSTEFDIIEVDGASALRRFARNMGLELNGKTGKSKSLVDAQVEGGKIAAIVDGFPYADITRQDFGIEMDLIERFIYSMKEYCADAKKHFFLTAHERVEYPPPSKENPSPEPKSIRPGFTGQTFPDTIPGMFDLVWRFESIGAAEQTQFYARTIGDESNFGVTSVGTKIVSKTCYPGVFKAKEYNPNILDIIKRIKESR